MSGCVVLNCLLGLNHNTREVTALFIKLERCIKLDFCRQLSQKLYYSIFPLMTRMKEQRLSLFNFQMAPCWEGLQMRWKTDGIQNSFDYLRKPGKNIQKRHAKFYSYLGKVSCSNVADRVGLATQVLQCHHWKTGFGLTMEGRPKMSQNFLLVWAGSITACL